MRWWPRRLSARLSALLLALGAAGCSGVASSASSTNGLTVLGGELDPRRWLAEPAARVAELGAGELEPVGAAVLGEGDQLGSFVDLSGDKCLLAVARSGASLRDVDLFVYADGGDRLGSDQSPAADAAVMVCPPRPDRMYVAARVVSGNGMVAVGVIPVPRDAAEKVAEAVAAHGLTDLNTGKLDAWPGLETKLRARRHALGASWEDVRRVALPLDPRSVSVVSAPILAGRCLDVFIAPSDEVQGLQVVAVDDSGQVVARGQTAGRDRSLVICSEDRRTITVKVRSRVSSGVAAVVMSRSPVGSVSELRQHNWIDGPTALAELPQARSEHDERLASLSYPLVDAPQEVALSAGQAKRVTIDFKRGCSRVDVIGGKPLGAFTAELWRDDGRPVAHSRGGAVASLHRCGPEAQLTLEVMALDRDGPAQVVTRTDPNAAAPLVTAEGAAARLLTRLEASDGPVDASSAGGAQNVLLRAGRSVRVPVTVAAGGCVDVVVALDGEPLGLSMSLFDPATASHRQSRGAHTTSGRLCAAAEPSSAYAELSIARGEASALLVIHRATP